MASFTIDTHLFRELGELLVGRDSTALIELIKNSYDADATDVVVLGQYLDDPDRGLIVITDNGSGMTPTQFERGFLRVASRMKDDGERLSGRLKRRYTGAKGIGRLAAHKLARLLVVDSVSVAENAGHMAAVHAEIDWDAIERFETLDEVDDNAVVFNSEKPSWEATTGTELRLSRLRRKWTPVERARFFSEVQSFSPPTFLTKALRKSIVGEPLLFDEPLVRRAVDSGQQFNVKLEGEFAAGEEYWRLIEEHAAWVIEIRSRPGESVKYKVAPTNRTLKELPDAIAYEAMINHPAPETGPFFDARIFLRVGQLSVRGDQRVWATRSSGVRVFMEGFRVLPYGEPQNDWLRLDADYTRRSRKLDTLNSWDIDDLGPVDDPDAGLMSLPNNNYFGGVFLTHEYATNLRMLVNREGFIPEGGYDDLVVLVRSGLDLCTRVNAAASYSKRKARSETRKQVAGPAGAGDLDPARLAPKASAERVPKSRIALKSSLAGATVALTAARAHLVESGKASSSVEAAKITEKIDQSLEEIQAQEELEELLTDEMISEQSLLRVLASVGTQMSAFVHEIRALLGSSQAVEHALDELASDPQLTGTQLQKLKKVLQAIGDLRRGLEREASYLTDIVTPDARRRRSRQKLAERFDVAGRLLAHTAERRGIRIESKIPADLKSPPMFPAELTAVFTNLLSNALKAAGQMGRIVASAGTNQNGSVHVLIQNTGVRVDLDRAETWFRPFESTTVEVDPVLGQGMGLGLPITRRMLDDYGAEIAFVSPDSDFATAIKFTFPGDK